VLQRRAEQPPAVQAAMRWVAAELPRSEPTNDDEKSARKGAFFSFQLVRRRRARKAKAARSKAATGTAYRP
jgi:hypothetical protein